ncbi:twin-arginine translocation signal domain-containing protein [Halovenus halobia]|uniref:twin-arginine translocation signal domain-containing protein n=1 Tax=Halovenus halobia TaxID=3396622 RepID=UPI003F572324
MERRDFIKGLGVAGASGLAGCSAITGGDDNGEDDQVGHRITDEGGGDYVMMRVDFVDQAGTLGQVDHMSNDGEADNLVNNYSEEQWQEMDDNDLDVAERILENNDSSVEQIRPWVEDALDRELEGYPDIESADAPPGPNEPDERAIMYGIGMGIGEESAISSSFDSAHVLKPLAEHFAEEYLDNEVFEAWTTGATEPVTEGRFVHLPVTMAYESEGGLRRDYVEPAVPDTPGLGNDAQAIRSPEESVYSDPDEMEMVTGHEYKKALEMAQNGKIEQEGRAHPTRAISTAVLADLWSMVDSAENDLNFESPPPNGLVTHVSQEFGRSVEDAFYDLDEEKLQYMENIGRGMQLFYEEHTGRTNLAVGGTLEEPEFYQFPDGMKETLWNFEYDSLSELEG